MSEMDGEYHEVRVNPDYNKIHRQKAEINRLKARIAELREVLSDIQSRICDIQSQVGNEWAYNRLADLYCRVQVELENGR